VAVKYGSSLSAKTVALTVNKADGAAVNGAPSMSERTASSITINAVSISGSNPGEQTVEYAISKDTETLPSSWQEETIFIGLEDSTTYYAFARFAEKENYNAGAARMSSAIKTLARCGSDDYDTEGRFCDDRDYKVYKYVTIGSQVWMAENLDYYVIGSLCYEGTDDFYDDDLSGTQGCARYGRLYDWATAMAIDASCNSALIANCGATVNTPHQGVCPSGWHVPSDTEWDALVTAAGLYTSARHLRAQSGWQDCGPEGSGKQYLCEDTYGLSALPGGYRHDYYGSFYDAGYFGFWLTASERYADYAHNWFMNNNDNNAHRATDLGKASGFSVRCVKDD
jgi:uncharacterized protein (TIGR02145 family)